jgi:hypothetical protein
MNYDAPAPDVTQKKRRSNYPRPGNRVSPGMRRGSLVPSKKSGGPKLARRPKSEY